MRTTIQRAKHFADFLKQAIRDYQNASLNWIWSNAELPSMAKTWMRAFLRILLILYYGSVEHRLGVHANALTYISVMSLIPLVAVVLATMQWTMVFDIEEMKHQLVERLPEFAPIIQKVLDYFQGTDFRGLGIAGFLVLMGAVISMFGKIERAFNDIWGVRQNRLFWEKWIDYTWIMIATSALVALAMGLQILAAVLIARTPAHLREVMDLDSGLYKLGTYAILWFTFSILFRYMPNTRVTWKGPIIGGFIGSFCYYLLSWVYFSFQIGLAKYNVIYSSIAALPITLIWLDISWLIILLASQLSYAITYYTKFNRHVINDVTPSEFQEKTTLQISLILAAYQQKDGIKEHFINNLSSDNPTSLNSKTPHCKDQSNDIKTFYQQIVNMESTAPALLSGFLNLPPAYILDLLNHMADQGLLLEKVGIGFVLKEDARKIRVKDVIKAIRQTERHFTSIENLDRWADEKTTEIESCSVNRMEGTLFDELNQMLSR